MKYDFSAIEKKWQEKWQKEKTYQTKNFVKGKPKFYGLVEFPYPSGAGLHVGHPVPTPLWTSSPERSGWTATMSSSHRV